jgi:hypothetical protein
MNGELLSGEDHVSRYCKPSTVEDDLPSVSAFMLRTGEDHLSVNWLEYFGVLDKPAAIQRIREAFHSKGYRLRKGGRLAVLNIEGIRVIAQESAQNSLRVEHLPREDDPSHAGILGYSVDDFEIAVEIRALVGRVDVYLAIPQ